MILDEVISEIEEARSEGFEYSEMELVVDEETHDNLLRDSGYNLRNQGPIDIDTIYGVDVVKYGEPELRKETQCRICDSDKVHHDTKGKWVCPFCEL